MTEDCCEGGHIVHSRSNCLCIRELTKSVRKSGVANAVGADGRMDHYKVAELLCWRVSLYNALQWSRDADCWLICSGPGDWVSERESTQSGLGVVALTMQIAGQLHEEATALQHPCALSFGRIENIEAVERLLRSIELMQYPVGHEHYQSRLAAALKARKRDAAAPVH